MKKEINSPKKHRQKIKPEHLIFVPQTKLPTYN
jgi:hypothetical protein